MKARAKIQALLDTKTLPAEGEKLFLNILQNKKEVLPGWTPSFLQKLGNINTVIDIGVLEGTPSLYKAFPGAKLYLIEPLPMYEAACKDIVRKHAGGGELFVCAAGAEDGSAEINYYPELPAQSSLLSSVILAQRETKVEIKQVTIPVKRLDTLFANVKLKGDVLLKIDTEGFEFKIIQGATETLKQIKYCITETSVRHRHKDSYRFADLVALMKSNGFDLYDVLTVTRPAADTPEASIIDAVFINSAMVSK